MSRAAAAAAALLLVAGCGGSGSPSAGSLAASFEERTGVRIVLDGTYRDPHIERLKPSPAARQRFGTFDVFVFDPQPGGGEAIDRALRAGSRAEPGGVYWRRLPDEGWVARKRYGENVLVLWGAGARRRTDERWRRLDRVLSKLA